LGGLNARGPPLDHAYTAVFDKAPIGHESCQLSVEPPNDPA
jgi:hypothetical protein